MFCCSEVKMDILNRMFGCLSWDISGSLKRVYWFFRQHPRQPKIYCSVTLKAAADVPLSWEIFLLRLGNFYKPIASVISCLIHWVPEAMSLWLKAIFLLKMLVGTNSFLGKKLYKWKLSTQPVNISEKRFDQGGGSFVRF